MSREHDVELFILKNAVITRDLRSAFVAQGTGKTRGMLEAQADSLVTEYLRQVDFETLADAERMSEFYKLFYALENDMRDLIESTLADSKGSEWWAKAVPQVVRDNVQKNHDREASEGLPPRSDRLINYTTFGELGEIVKENWDVFSGMFSNATRNRVLRVINRLNVVRGPIAHCNFLPEEEAIRLKLAIRDWYKLME
jgi:Swt1-like HEPN